jgi:hypothetical protein
LGRHDQGRIDQCRGCVVSCWTNWEVLERDTDLYAWSLFADRNQASGKVRQLELDHFKFQPIYAFNWCSHDSTSLGRIQVTSETLCSLCTNQSEVNLLSMQICCAVTFSKQCYYFKFNIFQNSVDTPIVFDHVRIALQFP